MVWNAKWTREKVIETIRDRHAQGLPYNALYLMSEEPALYSAIHTHFGAVGRVVRAAKVPKPTCLFTKRQLWTAQRVATALQKRLSVGKKINSNVVQCDDNKLYHAGVRIFGTWGNAVETVVPSYTDVRRQKEVRWSKKKILQEIQKIILSGQSLRHQDLDLQGKALHHAARKYFGRNGWQKARVLAGASASDPQWRIWTREKIIATIQEFHRKGLPLNTAALANGEGARLYRGAIKVFDTWMEALSAAGVDYSTVYKSMPRRWWTKKRVLDGIRALASQKIRLSSKSIQQGNGSLFQAAVVRFGCWSNAVEAAGFRYREHSLNWSSKAWLRKMGFIGTERIVQKAGLLSHRRRKCKRKYARPRGV